jgi:hypothetical protein
MIGELDVTSRVCFDHAGNHWLSKNGSRLFTLSYEGYKFPEEKRSVLDAIEEGLEMQNGVSHALPSWMVHL